VVSYIGGAVKGPMIIAVVCERMGWDYLTFQSQPTWFINLLLRKFEIDADQQKRATTH
jgi:hypothetical protein